MGLPCRQKQLGLVVHLGLNMGQDECTSMAAALAEACVETSQNKLGKIFSHFKKNHYPDMESFFEEFARVFVEAFFPTHAAPSFSFLFNILDKLEESWMGASFHALCSIMCVGADRQFVGCLHRCSIL